MRLFIATPVKIPIYGVIKNSLSKYVEGKWVEGWNLHLTHKFIGDGNPKDYKFTLNIPDEKIRITELGTFGKKVLYLKAHSEHINSVNTQINEKLNLCDEKPFIAHITLCRIKNIKDKKFFEEIKKFKFNIEIPFEVYLYKSTLTKKGPVYEKIYKY